MKEQFITHLESLVPHYKKAKFLLAVSGGIDSVVMTHLFYTYQLHFDIAHCNFHLRGEESNQDMNFVQNELIPGFRSTSEHKPSIFIKEFDTFAIQKDSGNSIEMVARDLRYDWFRELSTQYDFICTAHHANDNTETLFLHLIRGTGYKGLNGIPELNQPFLRPLLPFSSEQILQYAQANDLIYRFDSSNSSDQYQRNKIRNRVIPVLEEINPSLIATMNKNISLFSKQYSFYENQIQQLKDKLLVQNELETKIKIEELLQETNPEIILFEILSPFEFNFSTVEQIVKQLNGESGKQFYSEHFMLIKDRSFLFIYPKNGFQNNNFITINEPKELNQHGFEVQIISNSRDIKFDKNPDSAYFDFSKVHFPLQIRNWKEGDSFYPFGMKGKRKLSDFFKDLKLNLFQKQQINLLCELNHPNQILWVIGHRTSDKYKVDSKTEQILVIKKNMN